jgi:serine/threonine-protein kinase
VFNLKGTKLKILVGLLLFIVLDAVAQESEDLPELGATRIRDIDSMEMVYVPVGGFKMGSNNNQEQPPHDIFLDAFWIDRTEVTNAQFCKFLNANGNLNVDGVYWLEPGAGHRVIVYGHIDEVNGVFISSAGYENYPVIEVSWHGADAYCKWVGGRLPTEAEWEYAARGPASNIYPWGNEFIGSFVNYRDSSFNFDNNGKDTSFNDGFAKWSPVGSYPNGASWCGALDMAGNIHEWIGDWWSPNYYDLSPTKNPNGPDTGALKIGRGGSWYDQSWQVRSSYRKVLRPTSALMHWIGFRCVVPTE